MKTAIIAVLLALCFPAALAQTVVTPKDTPASRALSEAAQGYAQDQAAITTAIQQAQNALALNQKNLQATLQADQKSLFDQLSKDKHYKDLVAKINTEARQLNDAQLTANQAFQQQTATLQQKIQREQGVIQALTPIVQAENSWGADVVLDPATGKWTQKKK